MQRLAQGAQRREGRFSKLLYNAASIFPINSRIDGLVVDLFAGGGGASEGLALALGRDRVYTKDGGKPLQRAVFPTGF